MINKPSSPCTFEPVARRAGRGRARAGRAGRRIDGQSPRAAIGAETAPNAPGSFRRPPEHDDIRNPTDVDMLHFDTAQMAAITQAHFFSRVAEFIRDQTTVPAYRQAALDTALRTSLWAPHWSTLRDATEHDAALFMCFLLACATLGVDATHAAQAVRQTSEPETSMKLFLSERGLLRFSAFDVPDLTRPGAGA
jgi:hypothetical protein